MDTGTIIWICVYLAACCMGYLLFHKSLDGLNGCVKLVMCVVAFLVSPLLLIAAIIDTVRTLFNERA